MLPLHYMMHHYLTLCDENMFVSTVWPFVIARSRQIVLSTASDSAGVEIINKSDLLVRSGKPKSFCLPVSTRSELNKRHSV